MPSDETDDKTLHSSSTDDMNNDDDDDDDDEDGKYGHNKNARLVSLYG